MKEINKIELANAVIAEIHTEANRTARMSGFNRATKLVRGDKHAVIETTEFGYRKYTTGEYVPNAYLAKFGWKNTYYQSAECVVSIPPELWKKKGKWEKFMSEQTDG